MRYLLTVFQQKAPLQNTDNDENLLILDSIFLCYVIALHSFYIQLYGQIHGSERFHVTPISNYVNNIIEYRSHSLYSYY